MSMNQCLWAALSLMCSVPKAWSQQPAPDAPRHTKIMLSGRAAPLTRYDAPSLQTLTGELVEPVSGFDQLLVGASLATTPVQELGAVVGDAPLWMSMELLFGVEATARFAMSATLLGGYLLYDTAALDGGYCGALRARIYSDEDQNKALSFVHMEVLGGCLDLSLAEGLAARASFTAGIGPLFPTPSAGLISASGTAQLNLRHIIKKYLYIEAQGESSLIVILDDPRGLQPSLWSMISLGIGGAF